MNTPAHLIFGAAAFAQRDNPKTIWAAILGGLAPDFSLYLMAGVSLFILGIEPEIVFDQLYFSSAWQRVFAVDNSFVIWGVIALAAWHFKHRWIMVFALSALLHIAFDFPLHHDDGRAHFWPLSNWVFESPVSYWDPRHHGRITGLVEAIAVGVLTVILWKRFAGSGIKALWMPIEWVFVIIALLEIAPTLIFSIMCSGGTSG